MKKIIQLLAAVLLPVAIVGCDGNSSETQTGDTASTFVTDAKPPVAPPPPTAPPPTAPGVAIVEPQAIAGETTEYCVNPELDDQSAIDAALNPSTSASPASAAQLLPVPQYAGASRVGAAMSFRTLIAVDKDDANLKPVVDYLQATLGKSTGYQLPVNPLVADPAVVSAPSCIKLEIRELKGSNGQQIGPEGYSVIAAEKGVAIRAPTARGLFNGVQTLLQLFPPKVYNTTQPPSSNDIIYRTWDIPAVKIVDWPRFGYRGMTADLQLDFLSVETVKRLIDEMAHLKMNTLHLRMSMEQAHLMVTDGKAEPFPMKSDGPGLYNLKEFNDVVSYASSRLIAVVPAIVGSPLTLGQMDSCPSDRSDVEQCRESVARNYMEETIAGVATLTPGQYIDVGIADKSELTPAQFKTHIEIASAAVRKAGRKLMAGGTMGNYPLPADTLVQYWGVKSNSDFYRIKVPNANIEAVNNALQQGAKLIVSPLNRTIFDIKYDANTVDGFSVKEYINLEKSYNWDPLSAIVPENGKDRPLVKDEVLGVEGSIGGDHDVFEMHTPGGFPNSETYLDYMAFPRLASVAEIGWSPLSSHSWDSFKKRLGHQGARWEATGIGYYKSPDVEWESPSDMFIVNK
jgi:hexosaminidase